MTDCAVCYGKHDGEVHAATIRVHQWLRLRLQRALQPLPPRPPIKNARASQIQLREWQVVTDRERVRRYLHALALLWLEVSDRPWLLPLFLAILGRAPQTLAELAGERRRRIAA